MLSILLHCGETRWVNHPNTQQLIGGPPWKLARPNSHTPPCNSSRWSQWTACSGKVQRQQLQVLSWCCAWQWKCLCTWGVALCWWYVTPQISCVESETPAKGILTCASYNPTTDDCCEILTFVCFLPPLLKWYDMKWYGSNIRISIVFDTKTNSYLSKFFTLGNSDLKGPFQRKICHQWDAQIRFFFYWNGW